MTTREGSTPSQPAVSPDEVAREALACRLCPEIPEHRPVFRVTAAARLLIVGQAPGRRVHETGVPWNDPSGDLLRQWLGLDREAFYGSGRIAIVPAGLCYPGSEAGKGDRPPPPRCAALWQPRFAAALPALRLVLAVGACAQRHWRPGCASVEAAVRGWREGLAAAATGATPPVFALPHPSPRNRRWLSRRPWFASEVLPALRREVEAALAESATPPRGRSRLTLQR